ncbi:MAG TPA: pyridoxal phosphate-dependent aminotransferase [bacterium]|nr:pyridoxal phosphate-dependent aminotransferase [bacterium]
MSDFKVAPASAMSRLGTETAFEVLVKAKALEAQGKHIVHLEIGEPDFDTPTNISEAAIKALREGWTHYGPSPGLPDLRKAIADYVSKTRHIETHPDEVVVTPGGKPIIFFPIMALIDPGDEVIYPNPGFPIYESMINFVGGKAVPLHISEEKNFTFDVSELKEKISHKTKLVIINSPANPTGGGFSKKDIEDIAAIVKQYNCYVMSDEIYSRIMYGYEHYSIASLPGMKERTIILDGFSKTYAMTGWRAGFGVMPKDLAAMVSKLQTNSNSCTNSFVQKACIEALQGPQDSVNAMVTEFEKRRDFIVDGLNAIKGFSCKKPLGAFYVFPNITKTGLDSRKLADYLLNEAGVAALSGTAFGSFGEGYLRFSYANSLDNIKLALERIDKAMKKL